MSVDTLIPHLLRPHWLWALLALPLLWWLLEARRRRASVWTQVVDPHLLPHLLETRDAARHDWGRGVAVLAYVIAVVALAGPSWQRATQPLWRSQAPLVIAVDLSSASLAADMPPSRLLRMRAKLATLLRERDGGQVALVAFADDAYTVAPLTDDTGNLVLFLDALAPDVMPADGHRVDRAIDWSMRLLARAGRERGDILLFTDHADAAAVSAARLATSAGARISVLGVGEARGAPYRSTSGGIVHARLDEASLRQLARAGDGHYARMTLDDADLRTVNALMPAVADEAVNSDAGARTWQDQGYWLLPPLMVLALLGFRRRGVAAVLALVLVWPLGAPRAAELWRRPDQVRHAQMQDGARAYRDGDFAGAAREYAGIDSADAHYNRGNALAKAGRYPEALRAYDRALALQPGMADAVANRRAVEVAMRRQPPPGTASKDGQGRQGPSSGTGSSPQGNGHKRELQATELGRAGDPTAADPRRTDAPPSQPPAGARTPASPDPNQQPTPPVDPAAQQAADAAQRERMQHALRQAREGKRAAESRPGTARDETPAERERRIANEAWLQRVADDPGGLLRAKFQLEHQRRQQQGRGGGDEHDL